MNKWFSDKIFPTELQLNRTNTCVTVTRFLDLKLSISNDIISAKIYDKRGVFDVNIAFYLISIYLFILLFYLSINLFFFFFFFVVLDGDAPHDTFYDVYISQLIRFASQVSDFSNRNKILTFKFL